MKVGDLVRYPGAMKAHGSKKYSLGIIVQLNYLNYGHLCLVRWASDPYIPTECVLETLELVNENR